MSVLTLPAVVEVPMDEHLELLVAARVTDPARWPVGAQHGAELLALIRQTEQDCLAQHGEWDWELLTPELQNIYDGACIALNQLLSGGAETSFEDFLEELGLTEDVTAELSKPH
jgi:hypothetical protein